MQSVTKPKYLTLSSSNEYPPGTNMNPSSSSLFSSCVTGCSSFPTFRSLLFCVFTVCISLQLTFCLWNNTSCEMGTGYIYIVYGRQSYEYNNNNNLRSNGLPLLHSSSSSSSTASGYENSLRTAASSSVRDAYSSTKLPRATVRENSKRLRKGPDGRTGQNKPSRYFSEPESTKLSSSSSTFAKVITKETSARSSSIDRVSPSIDITKDHSLLLRAQGLPFMNNTEEGYYWPVALKQSIPTTDETMDRLGWYIDCLQLSRHRPSGQPPDYRTGTHGAEALRPTQLRKDYYRLKYMAFTFYQSFDNLWNETHLDAPPQADWGFYNGPWIEDYWRYTFGRPVRRTINIAEWQFQVKLIGSTSIRAITLPWDMNEDDLLLTLSPEQQTNYHTVLSLYTQMEGKGTIPSTEDIQTISEYNLPVVEVEELFDYDLFFPYVPLFIPWERIAIAASALFQMDEAYNGQTRMRDWLYNIERRIVESTTTSVAYLTVVQRAQGMILHEKSMLYPLLANTLIINAGGGGDIPIPLLADEQPWLEKNIPEFGNHRYWLSFIGSSREGLRNEVIRKSEERYGTHNASIVPPMKKEYASRFITKYFRADTSVPHVKKNDNEATLSSKYPWIPLMSNSMLQLTPRGINPTSFRLYEALQMGLIPVYIYDNERPWLPYYRWNGTMEYPRDSQIWKKRSSTNSPSPPQLWDQIGLVIHIDDYDSFLDNLPLLSQDAEWYETMRSNIRRVRNDYFTYEGVTRQMYRMLINPRKSDMTCSIPSQLYF